MDKLRDANYDGIQEYDNDLPRWWRWLFYISMVFGVIYVVRYHIFDAPRAEQILAADLAEIQKLKQEALAMAASGAPTEETLLALSKDVEAVKLGKEVFQIRCMACHGPQGQGLVGPNLTDNAFIHGPKLLDALNVVENGVTVKGMLAWKGVIPDKDIRNVVAYIHTLRGTNPPNPKAPEGTPVS